MLVLFLVIGLLIVLGLGEWMRYKNYSKKIKPGEYNDRY